MTSKTSLNATPPAAAVKDYDQETAAQGSGEDADDEAAKFLMPSCSRSCWLGLPPYYQVVAGHEVANFVSA